MRSFPVCSLLAVFFSTLSGQVQNPQTTLPPPQSFDTSLLSSYEKYIDSSILSWNVPGLAIAIVKDNQTIYAKGFGVKKIGMAEKINTQTLFQIGSLTQSFTSTLVGMMVDEGKLKWEESVQTYYPEFMLYDPWVTREFQVQDLFCHRSGLPPNAGDLQSYLGFSQRQILHNLRYIKPVTSFRSVYAYQNSFFLVASEILNRVSGESWAELVQERIFYPLGMKDTSSSLEKFQSNPNAAARHAKLDKKIQLLTNDDPTLNAVYIYSPAGGINSTIEDLSQWLKLQINNGVFNETPLIGEENIRKIRRSYIWLGDLFNSENYACLGWAKRRYSPYPIFWYSGRTSGSSSLMAFIPEEKLGVVILSNISEPAINYALAWQFFDLYYKKSEASWSAKLLEEQLETDQPKQLKKNTDLSPPANLELYSGVYFNPMYGLAEVIGDKEGLILSLGPKKVKLSLKPWNRDTFELQWPQVSGIESTKAYFSKQEDGYYGELTLEMLDVNSDGVFKRIGE